MSAQLAAAHVFALPTRYEPFGIAQVEPICFGGICVFSACCGCAGFVHKIAGHGSAVPNVIVADYTQLGVHSLSAEQLLLIGQQQRDEIEHRVAAMVANELMQRLPSTPAEVEQSIECGYRLAEQMSWEAVSRDYVIPGIQRAARAQRLKQIA